MFIETPNIPKKMIKAVLIDHRAALTKNALESIGIKVYITPVLDVGYPAISGHPDIMFHHLDRNTLISSPEVYSYFSNLFPDSNIIKGKSFIKSTYPFDIAYNVARVGNFAIHNLKYTDKLIYEYYSEKKIKLIQTKQGYSKCSVCIVSDNAIITSDKSIKQAAEKNNIDVLLISEGYIILKDFPCGFIGGASGLISNNILAFNGNIRLHPDYSNILSFCKNYNVELYSLHNGELEDIGSIIPLC